MGGRLQSKINKNPLLEYPTLRRAPQGGLYLKLNIVGVYGVAIGYAMKIRSRKMCIRDRAYTVSAWEAMQDGTLHLDRVKTYLQGYNDYLKKDGTLTPFIDEEVKAFPYMMLAADIYLFNWATDYFNFWEDYNEFEWYYYCLLYTSSKISNFQF